MPLPAMNVRFSPEKLDEHHRKGHRALKECYEPGAKPGS